MKKKILNWWRLDPSPTSYNEYFILELSGAWEPADSSRAQGFDPGTRSFSHVYSRNRRLGDIRDRLRMGDYFGVSKVNLGGGLALFWKEGVEVSIDSSSLNHIDVLINKNKEDEWRFTGFYGEPLTQRRVESWNLLRNLHGRFSVPWLCVGDFNEITKSHEKRGGRLRPYR